MKLLNIGCGNIYHEDWVNIDLTSDSEAVLQHDLSQGLPFAANSFDACYSSHVLEHLSLADANAFLEEQKRVLRPGGIIRVVVPDLETISRHYITYLEELVAGDLSNEFKYDYSLLEMYDQVTREQPGGELLNLWSSPDIPDLDYVVMRHGKEALDNIQAAQSEQVTSTPEKLKKLMTFKGLQKASYTLRIKIIELLVLLVGNKSMVRSFRRGLFRDSGEIHRVMYDTYSLQRILASHGFTHLKVCQFDQSEIPDFNQYQLDAFEGKIRKPDSLYIEALNA